MAFSVWKTDVRVIGSKMAERSKDCTPVLRAIFATFGGFVQSLIPRRSRHRVDCLDSRLSFLKIWAVGHLRFRQTGRVNLPEVQLWQVHDDPQAKSRSEMAQNLVKKLPLCATFWHARRAPSRATNPRVASLCDRTSHGQTRVAQHWGCATSDGRPFGERGNERTGVIIERRNSCLRARKVGYWFRPVACSEQLYESGT
jgi:hypothetical protein